NSGGVGPDLRARGMPPAGFVFREIFQAFRSRCRDGRESPSGRAALSPEAAPKPAILGPRRADRSYNRARTDGRGTPMFRGPRLGRCLAALALAAVLAACGGSGERQLYVIKF